MLGRAMRIPTIRGVIDRRILVNYRIDADLASRVLPSPFKPQLVSGFAVGGICLIRLKHVRPRGVPAFLGIRSENAAHRIAVEWTEDGEQRTGVYVPRRDTGSRLNALVGGRVFPGEHHLTRFRVEEADPRYEVSLESRDRETKMSVSARRTEQWGRDSVFPTLRAASEFFASGSLGYSATKEPGRFDGLELRCASWHVDPLEVESVTSSYFFDTNRFPSGSVGFDCALLMRGIEHEWIGRADLHGSCA